VSFQPKRPDPLAGVPLHNIEIEQGLLGALMLHNTNFDVVAGKLQPEHFFEPVHQALFAEIARKIGLGEPATPLTVRGAFPNAMDLGGLSINQYLARLAAESTVAMNIPYFADTTMQYSAVREHVLNARDLVDGCLGGVPVDEALKIFHDQSEATRNGFLGPGLRDTSATMEQTVEAAFDRMTAAVNNEPMALGLPTCIAELDKIIGGLVRGNLVVIAGRPGMGKSTVMCSVGRQVALQGYGVGIISLEMDQVQIGYRLLTDHAYNPAERIPYTAIVKGHLTTRDQEVLTLSGRDLKETAPIEFDFATSMTVAEVAATARRMAARLAKRGRGLDLLMIDYLKFIKATNRYAGIKHYEIGEITAALKGLARILNCCVVLFHQLNREVEKTGDKRPGMEHLRESGDVEQDADLIILLYREGYYIDRSGDLANPEKEAIAKAAKQRVEFDLDMIVAKQRMGPAADVKVFCDITTSSLRSRASVHQAFRTEPRQETVPGVGPPHLEDF
jgi:replicative DNA helicase